MIDNICIKIPRKSNEGIIDHLKDVRRRDTHTYSGYIQNMGVFVGLDCIVIRGSIAKFLNGQNVSTLTCPSIKVAIKKLEREIGITLEAAIVTMVECGIGIKTKEKPSEYLKLFGYPPRFTRHEYAKNSGVETITYSTQTGSYEFSGYDKIQEVQSKKSRKYPLRLKVKISCGLNIKLPE